MNIIALIDAIPLVPLLLIAVGSMVGCIELGFYIGSVHADKCYKAQMAQVRAIMGALLGLVAFLLAFSFSMAQGHFEDRSRAYLLEANALGDAWRAADLIEPETGAIAQDLLRRYVDSRVALREAVDDGRREAVEQQFQEAELATSLLWDVARTAARSHDEAETPLTRAVLGIIDAKTQRLQATLYNRISGVIWLTLLGVSTLAMLVMGYQAGLTGTRSRLATWTLAVTFAAVMTLITDLDRPKMTLFSLNNQIMVDLQYRMHQGDLHGNYRSPLQH